MKLQQSQVPNPGQEVCSDGSVRMPGGLPGTAGFVRLNGAGNLEIEFFDFSEQAQLSFGNDVVTTYTIAHKDLAKLVAELALPESPTDGFHDLPRLFAKQFSGVMTLINAIKASGIRVKTSFDSWA